MRCLFLSVSGSLLGSFLVLAQGPQLVLEDLEKVEVPSGEQLSLLPPSTDQNTSLSTGARVPVLIWGQPSVRVIDRETGMVLEEQRAPQPAAGLSPEHNVLVFDATDGFTLYGAQFPAGMSWQWDPEVLRPFLVARYAEAPVVRIDLLRSAREQALEALSLSDINRYQFRRNRSEEPGLPVSTPARPVRRQIRGR